MQPKIDSDFWNDPDIEALDGPSKAAVLYIITKADILGCATISKRRFEFDTGFPVEALHRAVKALPNSIKPLAMEEDGKIVLWAANYIGHQFGRGERLMRNNISKSIIKALELADAPLRDWILQEYPDLAQGLMKGLVRACEGLTKPLEGLPESQQGVCEPQQGEREGEREREGEGAMEGVQGEPSTVTFAEPSLPPATVFRQTDTMRRLGALFKRPEALQWSAEERLAFRCRAPEITEEHLVAVERYYTANLPPSEKRKRYTLASLLDNWASEVGVALDWAERTKPKPRVF